MASAATPSQRMIHLFMGFVPARAIYVAAKLGIADLLLAGPGDTSRLAAATRCDADALRRVLRLLAAIGVLSRDDAGAFALTELGRTLCSDAPDSVRDLVLLHHELQYPSLGHILDSVRTGGPAFAKAFGAPIFEHVKADPDAASVFVAGLSSRSRIDVPALLEAYDFSRCRRVVDVGGGSGAFLAAVLERHPHVTGTLYDLAPAIEAARPRFAAMGGRCELVPGDFFEGVPGGADTYVLKLVLHDWSDDEAVRILARCREAIAPDGRLLVVEGLIGDTGGPTMTDYTDIVMLVSMTGAERSETALAALLDRAGFRLARVVPTASDLFILEAVPA